MEYYGKGRGRVPEQCRLYPISVRNRRFESSLLKGHPVDAKFSVYLDIGVDHFDRPPSHSMAPRRFGPGENEITVRKRIFVRGSTVGLRNTDTYTPAPVPFYFDSCGIAIGGKIPMAYLRAFGFNQVAEILSEAVKQRAG
ncbi:hypothetical protein GWI33_017412 [Rhynchophorus ferrugineus]|uniref:Uncharacterized protein n=1 Tax=Rhynchophorus ferrugineus TaxID=354439 RepID=A0A834IVZ6_RHYFE|nr:hypothetical protein GWI33_017412 [Rhynchophorus ferrugineus]